MVFVYLQDEFDLDLVLILVLDVIVQLHVVVARSNSTNRLSLDRGNTVGNDERGTRRGGVIFKRDHDG